MVASNSVGYLVDEVDRFWQFPLEYEVVGVVSKKYLSIYGL